MAHPGAWSAGTRGTLAVVVLAAVAACGDTPSSTTTSSVASSPVAPASVAPSSSASGPSASSSSGVPQLALVGEWQRTQTCPELVKAFTDAGLTKLVPDFVAGSELVPGVINDAIKLQDKNRPCIGAVPRSHSHFFTSDGHFGSRNYAGKQVDDGTYQVLDRNTVRINTVKMHFQITGHSTLRFTPILPACAPKSCFDAGYAVAVANPGHEWTRLK